MCGRDELMHERRARVPEVQTDPFPHMRALEMSQRDLYLIAEEHGEVLTYGAPTRAHGHRGRLLQHIAHLQHQVADLKHRLHLSEQISLSLALSAAAAANPLTHPTTEGGDSDMTIQTYIEKPAEPRRVKAFQLPEGAEKLTFDDGAGNTGEYFAGDYVEVDLANNHVGAFKKADFEAKFILEVTPEAA